MIISQALYRIYINHKRQETTPNRQLECDLFNFKTVTKHYLKGMYLINQI